MKKFSYTTALSDKLLINLYLEQLQRKAKVNIIPNHSAVVRLFEQYINKVVLDSECLIFKVPCNQDVRCGQYATFAEFTMTKINNDVYVRFTRERANKNNNCLTTKHRIWL